MKCPKCLAELNIECVANIPDIQILRMTLTPNKDAMIMAQTLGGALSSFSKLMDAMGKSHGMKITTSVKEIITHEDHSIEFVFVVARLIPQRSEG